MQGIVEVIRNLAAAQLAKSRAPRILVLITATIAPSPPEHNEVAIARVRPVVPKLRSDLHAMTAIEPVFA